MRFVCGECKESQHILDYQSLRQLGKLVCKNCGSSQLYPELAPQQQEKTHPVRVLNKNIERSVKTAFIQVPAPEAPQPSPAPTSLKNLHLRLESLLDSDDENSFQEPTAENDPFSRDNKTVPDMKVPVMPFEDDEQEPQPTKQEIINELVDLSYHESTEPTTTSPPLEDQLNIAPEIPLDIDHGDFHDNNTVQILGSSSPILRSDSLAQTQELSFITQTKNFNAPESDESKAFVPLYLRVYSSNNYSYENRFVQSKISFGKDETSDVKLQDESLLDTHSIIRYDHHEKTYVISNTNHEDLWINGKQQKSNYVLRNKDQISLGKYQIEVSYAPLLDFSLTIEIKSNLNKNLFIRTNGKDWSHEINPSIPDELIRRLSEGNGDIRCATELGRRLFKALKQYKGFELNYKDALAQASAQKPLRINLAFAPNVDAADRLDAASYPWETLFDEEQFLALEPQIRLSRQIVGIHPLPIPSLTAPEKLTIAFSNPRGATEKHTIPALHLFREYQFFNAFKRTAQTTFDLEIVTRLGTDNIQNIFHNRGLLHISGQINDNKLQLQNVDGEVEELVVSDITKYIRTNNLSAAVVNCLETHANNDIAENRLSQTLVASIPFVIGISGRINDQSARVFPEEFYTRLAAGEPIDEAIQNTRWRLFAEESTSADAFLFTAWSNTTAAFPLSKPLAETSLSQIKQKYKEISQYKTALTSKVQSIKYFIKFFPQLILNPAQLYECAEQVALQLLQKPDIEETKAEDFLSITTEIVKQAPIRFRSTTSFNGARTIKNIVYNPPKLFNPTKDEVKTPLAISMESGLSDIVGKALGNLILPKHVVLRCINSLLAGKHLIITGAPGTGKSTLANNITEAFGYLPFTQTAQPSWTTQDIIGEPSYNLQEQSHSNARLGCINATIQRYLNIRREGHNRGAWLIIEDFNKAPMDLIFGDLQTALASGKLSPVISPENIMEYNELPIPEDLRIIGTASTFDRDFHGNLSNALKRRFAFVEIPAFREGFSGIAADNDIDRLVQQVMDKTSVKTHPTSNAKDVVRNFIQILEPTIKRIRITYPVGMAVVIDILTSCYINKALNPAVDDRAILSAVLPDQIQHLLESLPIENLLLTSCILEGKFNETLRSTLIRIHEQNSLASQYNLNLYIESLASYLQEEKQEAWSKFIEQVKNDMIIMNCRSLAELIPQNSEPAKLPESIRLAKALRRLAMLRAQKQAYESENRVQM